MPLLAMCCTFDGGKNSVQPIEQAKQIPKSETKELLASVKCLGAEKLHQSTDVAGAASFQA